MGGFIFKLKKCCFQYGPESDSFLLDQNWYNHKENTRREESKYLECENSQLGISAIATYIFKPSMEKFKIGR